MPLCLQQRVSNDAVLAYMCPSLMHVCRMVREANELQHPEPSYICSVHTTPAKHMQRSGGCIQFMALEAWALQWLPL